MKIVTIENKYLQLSSDYIKDIILNINDYKKLSITYVRNCIDSTAITVEVPLNSVLDCKGNSSNTYKYDMGIVKGQSGIVKEIRLKHLITGSELVTGLINLNFNNYNTLCPSGCELETLGTTFTDPIKIALTNLLSANSLPYSNLDVYYCGDVLIVSGLPLNIIPTTIELTNGYKGIFTSNIGLNKLILQDDIFLSASFFGTTTIADGIYSIKLLITKNNGNTISEENCVFVDTTTKCRVAEKIEFLLAKEFLEKDMTQELMTIYQGLVLGSNCGGCNCKELCDLYDKLQKLLNSNILVSDNTIKINNCHSGCK